MSDTLRERFDHYIGELFSPGEDDILKQIQASTEANDMPSISVQPFEGYLLGWLVRLVGAKTIVEVGTLAGYSGTWMARSLSADGKLYTVEKSSKHAKVAQANFEKAGLHDRVEVLQGDALAILGKVAAQGPFDMIFIDANKDQYPDYLAWAVENLRIGGIVTAHNAFRNGEIFDPQTDNDKGMARYNQALADDPRMDSVIIPMGDGLAVGVKRS
jgi:caffeoyl-CoA O-methyltransferase